MKKKEVGFTLIELLIVIAIVALLASVVLISLTSSREKAAIASYKAQVDSLVPSLINSCMANPTLDSATVNSILGIAEGSSKRKVGAAANINVVAGATSCGSGGAGTFNVRVNSADLGGGAAATACETDSGTVLTHTGIVTFPAACR